MNKYYVARDYSGSIAMFDEEPIKDGDEWIKRGFHSSSVELPRCMFMEVTFENSPKLVTVSDLENH